jgi:hypothetical protein
MRAVAEFVGQRELDVPGHERVAVGRLHIGVGVRVGQRRRNSQLADPLAAEKPVQRRDFRGQQRMQTPRVVVARLEQGHGTLRVFGGGRRGARSGNRVAGAGRPRDFGGFSRFAGGGPGLVGARGAGGGVGLAEMRVRHHDAGVDDGPRDPVSRCRVRLERRIALHRGDGAIDLRTDLEIRPDAIDRSIFEPALGLVGLHQPARLVHADEAAVVGLRHPDWRSVRGVLENEASIQIFERVVCGGEAAVFLEVQLDDIRGVLVGIVRQPEILARCRIVQPAREGRPGEVQPILRVRGDFLFH